MSYFLHPTWLANRQDMQDNSVSNAETSHHSVNLFQISLKHENESWTANKLMTTNNNKQQQTHISYQNQSKKSQTANIYPFVIIKINHNNLVSIIKRSIQSFKGVSEIKDCTHN